jgi:hypothetical protein
MIVELQSVIDRMELEYPDKTFFTSHMVVRNFMHMFPNSGLYKCEIRRYLKRPYFRLDDRKGWRNFIRRK